MSKKSAVPDAWDDDWVNVADKPQSTPDPALQQPIKISRSQLKAQHQEANKQLWKAAEEPERFHYLEAKTDVPLKTDFKPAVKVLSRKPTPQLASRNDPSSQLAGLTLEGDDSEEEEERKRNEAAFVERQKKAVLDREEKQRKYAEVRERLFGSTKPASRDSSSDNRAPPGPGRNLSNNAEPRNASRKGRARNNRDSQSASADQSPARPMNQARQLFDPSYDATPKSQSPKPTLQKEEQPIRMPRGPDGSGRGGFGFAPRGGNSTLE
ncbi:hypothetical protein MBLNU459_g6970t1 [Dothideomycetes sp. NU459]